MLLLWRWWSVQNKVNQGGKGLSADEVAADVLKLITDMGSTERQQPIRSVAAVKKWNAPPQGQLKINTDGSFIPETLQGSWGFIVRDHDGDAVLAGAGRLGAAPDALTTEATACQQALQAATITVYHAFRLRLIRLFCSMLYNLQLWIWRPVG